jgi:Protein of unknown function (DUF3800)
MAEPANTAQGIAHYFVDESGDGVLFGKQGKLLLGEAGVCNQFMLGMLQVANPVLLASELEALRADLLRDPYFKNVASMQPARQKTALMFHAKDDVPEVRREVFRLLARHDIKFYAMVRDMHYVLANVLERNQRDAAYRYRPDELYDRAVERLFQNRLHMYESCHICYGVRGTADRMRAFQGALDISRSRFESKWNKTVTTQIVLEPSSPRKEPCLQAVDYVLWALQRYFNQAESRFIELLWDKVGLVVAADDKTAAGYGMYYTKKNPLPALTGAGV